MIFIIFPQIRKSIVLLFLGAGQVPAHALDQSLIARISSSVLSIQTLDRDVIATAVVWDYIDSEVLVLPNYHTWDAPEYKYCFPPKPKNFKSNKQTDKKRKRTASDLDEDSVRLILTNDGFRREFVVTSELFHSCEENKDYAVLQLPKDGFTMERLPVFL